MTNPKIRVCRFCAKDISITENADEHEIGCVSVMISMIQNQLTDIKKRMDEIGRMFSGKWERT
jgi:hypothetical protein